MTRKKILLVDDHPLIREGLKHIVNSAPDLCVAGEAGSAAQALSLTRSLKPDCLTMDISLPDNSGIYVLENLARNPCPPPVLMLSMYRQRAKILEAFQAGAMGYVNKESAAELLIEALRTVLRGEIYLDESLSVSVVDLLRAPAPDKTNSDRGYATLTPREQEVMRLLAEGLSAKDIGKRLFISSKTVDNHRANLMKKLSLETTMDIVRYAARLGLIDLAAWKDS